MGKKKNKDSIELQLNYKQTHIEVDLENLLVNLYLRKKIYDCHYNDRDQIRIAYLQKDLLNYLKSFM
jgi:hypothetical protein